MSEFSKALLIVAHGSRREQSNEEVRNLTATISAQAGNEFTHVSCAFLELAAPSIPEGIEQCIQGGASEVVVMPYFLSAGRHVVHDIPDQVAGKASEHPDVTISVAPYLGTSEGIAALMLDLSRNR